LSAFALASSSLYLEKADDDVDLIEHNGNKQQIAPKGSAVICKIVNESNPNIQYERQFDASRMLYSNLNRTSTNALKENFKMEEPLFDLTFSLRYLG
jgi:hypothetical protein